MDIAFNEKAMLAGSDTLKNAEGFVNQVFNIAYGGNTTLNQLFETLRTNLSRFNREIARLEPVFGPYRAGDIPHSLASIDKARSLLGYDPQYSAEKGFEIACGWYWGVK